MKKTKKSFLLNRKMIQRNDTGRCCREMQRDDLQEEDTDSVLQRKDDLELKMETDFGKSRRN